MKIQIKLFIGFFLIASLFIILTYISLIAGQNALEESIGGSSVLLAEEIMDEIDHSISNRIETFQAYSKDLILQNNIVKSNQEFDNIEEVQQYIDEKDNEWVAVSKETITPFMQELLDNELSEELREKIEFYEEKYDYVVYGEAFVTNKYGANVGLTGKTFDYYQADEEWWQKAKEDGLYVGNVEYDKSAGIYSLDICVRVDDENGEFLGVIKTVLNIQEIIEIIKKLELEEHEELSEHEVHGHESHDTMEFKLLTRDGRVIYATEDYDFFENIYNETIARFNKIEDPEHKDYFIGSGDMPGEEDELFAHAHSKGYKDYKGLGWFLIIEHETEEIFAPISHWKKVIIFSSAIIILILIVLSYYLNRMAVDLEKYQQKLIRLGKNRSKRLKKEVARKTKELNKQVQELNYTKTAVLNMMEDLKVANDKLKELDQAKSNFLNVVSHELKTPLTAIYAHLDLMDDLKSNLTEQELKSLTTIKRNSHSLKILIDNILEIARMEANKFELSLEKVDLNYTVNEVIKNLQILAEKKGLKLKYNKSKISKLPKVIADEQRLREILTNLIHNAIKFTHQGSINIGAKKRGNFVEVSVIDTGMGIPKDKMKNLFQKFYQVDAPTSRSYGGTGLGLSITKNLVELQGGEINVKSKQGKGSTFYFTLPIKAEGSKPKNSKKAS